MTVAALWLIKAPSFEQYCSLCQVTKDMRQPKRISLNFLVENALLRCLNVSQDKTGPLT